MTKTELIREMIRQAREKLDTIEGRTAVEDNDDVLEDVYHWLVNSICDLDIALAQDEWEQMPRGSPSVAEAKAHDGTLVVEAQASFVVPHAAAVDVTKQTLADLINQNRPSGVTDQDIGRFVVIDTSLD